MQVDPIGAVSARAAANALQELTRQSRIISQRIVENSNYLQKLGEGVATSETNRARNREFFRIMSRNLPGHR